MALLPAHTMFYLTSILLVATTLLTPTGAEPCPGTPCECTPGANPQEVDLIDCSNRGLTEVPDFTEIYQGEVGLVDFSGNNFVTFDPFGFGFQFISVRSINLLDLSNNQLVSIVNPFAVNRNATASAPQYDVLNLSRNNFDTFPANAIPLDLFTRSKLVIDISDNRLTSLSERFIGDTAVSIISTLRFDAKNNLIETVHPNAFSGASIADLFLDLSGNRLTSLPRDFDFPESNNNGFNMSGNPWNCSCDFRWIATSFLRKAWRNDPPLCSDPAPLRDTPVFDLRPEEFVCKPKVNANYDDIVIETENNVLECPATANPQSTLGITWRFSLSCSDRPIPLTLIANSRVATIREATCFPEANVSCTAFNHGGSVDVPLTLIPTGDASRCSSGGGRGGFIFLIILFVFSLIVLACVAGYYVYLLRENKRSVQSNTAASAQYANNTVNTNPTRPTRAAPAPPSYR